MELVKNIGAAICAAAFTAGILDLLFPAGNLKTVINAILALYILASALNATQGGRTDSLAQQLFLAAQQKTSFMDFSEYTARQYENALQNAQAEETKDAQVEVDGNDILR